MSYQQIRTPNFNVTNSLKSAAVYSDVVGNSNNQVTTPLNYTSVQELRNALTASNGTYYTGQKLDQMTVNDMIYAVRMIRDRTTIADYLPASTA